MRSTNIGWTDSTINGTSGCDGCELFRPDSDGNDPKGSCYAREVHENRLAAALPAMYAAKFNEVRMISGRFHNAANWSDLRGKDHADKPWLNGAPRHIFVGDMGDILSSAITDEFLEKELLGAITSKNGKRHVWQILTKRPDRLAALSEKWGGLPDNCVAMTSVTNQRTADVRIPHLLRVKCRTLGLSCEPLLGPVDLRRIKPWHPIHGPDGEDSLGGGSWGHADVRRLAGGGPGYRNHSGSPRINWVICGGESGKNARPMHPNWARSLRDQCAETNTPFFFKQWGHFGLNAPVADGRLVFDGAIVVANDGTVYAPEDLAVDGGKRYNEALRAKHDKADLTRMYPVGARKSGRMLDGQEHSGIPCSIAAAA